MTLGDYLKSQNISRADFGDMIGVDEVSVGRYVRRERVPRPDVMRRIKAATNGEVTADSFLGVPENEAA